MILNSYIIQSATSEFVLLLSVNHVTLIGQNIDLINTSRRKIKYYSSISNTVYQQAQHKY